MISEDNLAKAYKLIGIRETSIEDVMKMNDLDNDGGICYQEFKLIFAGDEQREEYRENAKE